MSKKRKDHYDKGVYRSFALVMQFGINMLVPICMMSALGIFLDRKLGTSYIMIILFFVGAIAGGQNIYRMAKRIYEEPEENRHQGTGSRTDRKKESDSSDEGHGNIKKGR